MTKLSRYIIEPKNLSRFIDNFWTTVTLLESKNEVKEFLSDILTRTEIKMFVKRLQIAKMLLSGYDYNTIKRYVRVTHQTIASVANVVKDEERKGLKRAISYLNKMESDFQEELDKNYNQAPSLGRFINRSGIDKGVTILSKGLDSWSRKQSRKQSVQHRI